MTRALIALSQLVLALGMLWAGVFMWGIAKL